MSNLRSRWTGVELDDASVALPWTAICASGDEEAHEPLVPGPLPEPDVGWAPVPELAAAETTLELLVEMFHADAEAASQDAVSTFDRLRAVYSVPLNLEKVLHSSLDRALEEHFPRFQQVLHDPAERLDVESVRLPVARARKIRPRALAYLAGRPEDWNWRTIDGVDPKRVLADALILSFDTYENRVALTLLDRLQQAVDRRYQELVQLLGALDWRRMQEKAGSDIHHRLRQRVTRRWGEAFSQVSDGNQLERLRKRRDQLRAYRQRLFALRASPLARALGPKARIVGTPRTTNVLREDPNYRSVLALWLAVERAAMKPQRTALERRKREHAQLVAFTHYGATLVAREFADLGFHHVDVADLNATQAGAGPRRFFLEGPLGQLTWSWDGPGEIRIDAKDSDSLRLVFAPCRLPTTSTAAVDRALAAHRVRSEVGSRPTRVDDDDTLSTLVYVDEWTIRDETADTIDIREDLSERAYAFLHGPNGARLATLPISPLVPMAAERVGRLLRRWLLGASWNAANDPFGRRGSVMDAERQLNDARVKVGAATAKKRLLEEQLADAEARQDQAVKRRRSLDPLNRERTQTKQQLRDVEMRLDRLREEIASLEQDLALMAAAVHCPDDPGDATATSLKGGWKAQCRSCGAEWGYLPQAGGGSDGALFHLPKGIHRDRKPSDWQLVESLGREWLGSF